MRKVLIAGACLAAACTPNEGQASVPQEAAVAATGGFISRDHGATTVPPETTTTTAEVEVTTTTVAEVVEDTTTTHYHPPVTTTSVYVAPAAKSPTTEGSGWAIPTYIVMCESGGDWDAYNPSGASGPYQLMPLHFNGKLAMNQSRAAQHAKAAELWAGGAGRSHWAACL